MTATVPTTEKMVPANKAKWIKALRSGEYRQGRACLYSVDDDGQGSFCCLGVFADVIIAPSRLEVIHGEGVVRGAAHGFLPALWKGLSQWVQEKLVYLNDEEMYTFDQIADWIEENL